MYDNTIRITIVPMELVLLPEAHAQRQLYSQERMTAVTWLTQLMYDFPEVGHEDSACGKSAAQARKHHLKDHSNTRVMYSVRVCSICNTININVHQRRAVATFIIWNNRTVLAGQDAYCGRHLFRNLFLYLDVP